MRGYLSTKRRILPADIVLGPDGVRGLIISLSAGVIAGCLTASLKFHLGLPGHKALLWMTPVIAARLAGGCRIGTTAGALTAAFVTLGLGANLAGSALGLPLIAVAGALIDAFIIRLEKHKASTLATIVGVAFIAMSANLICCAKRLLLPTGVAPQDVFSAVDFLLRPVWYGFFGFLAGFIAATGVQIIRRRNRPKKIKNN